MEAYQPPNFDYEKSSPEQAQAEINRVWAEVSKDPEHPVLNANHAQYGDYKAHKQRLYEIVCNAEAASAKEADQVLAAQLANGASAKQEILVNEAKKEIERLAVLGYESAEIPVDVDPVTVRLLKAQRFSAEHNFDKAHFEVENVLRENNVDKETITAVRMFMGLKSLDNSQKADMMDSVLSLLNRSLKKGK
ncbi:MAG: hypothetical protein A2Y12_05495 [Planctomycetes bacterium GWF2_42_9]|nr:MAG: hypothetical protein A2Y12_05495 [Planctomycetes bacterium GWF2_42_9]